MSFVGVFHSGELYMDIGSVIDIGILLAAVGWVGYVFYNSYQTDEKHRLEEAPKSVVPIQKPKRKYVRKTSTKKVDEEKVSGESK